MLPEDFGVHGECRDSATSSRSPSSPSPSSDHPPSPTCSAAGSLCSSSSSSGYNSDSRFYLLDDHKVVVALIPRDYARLSHQWGSDFIALSRRTTVLSCDVISGVWMRSWRKVKSSVHHEAHHLVHYVLESASAMVYYGVSIDPLQSQFCSSCNSKQSLGTYVRIFMLMKIFNIPLKRQMD